MLFLLPFQALIGGLQRRNWGGWEKIDPPVAKKVFGFLLTFAVGAAVTQNLLAATAFSFFIGLAYLNPLHAWGQGMGDDPAKPLWQCVLVMGASYGAFTALAAAAVVYCTGDLAYAQYALHGFLVPVFYCLAKAFWPKDKGLWHTGQRYNPDTGVLEQQWFIDGGFDAVGEVCLGALLLTL